MEETVSELPALVQSSGPPLAKGSLRPTCKEPVECFDSECWRQPEQPEGFTCHRLRCYSQVDLPSSFSLIESWAQWRLHHDVARGKKRSVGYE